MYERACIHSRAVRELKHQKGNNEIAANRPEILKDDASSRVYSWQRGNNAEAMERIHVTKEIEWPRQNWKRDRIVFLLKKALRRSVDLSTGITIESSISYPIPSKETRFVSIYPSPQLSWKEREREREKHTYVT